MLLAVRMGTESLRLYYTNKPYYYLRRMQMCPHKYVLF